MPVADKFEDTMYVTAFELARDGLSDAQIAKTLGVTGPTLTAWVRKRPALGEAISRGRWRRDPGDEYTFHEYIYQHLDPHLQELWDEINACQDLDSPRERVEALLRGHGIKARQHLFLHALVTSAFNVSKSLRLLCIPRKTYEHWVASDPDFQDLVNEINWHKDNFFEQAFMGRVAAGDTAAVIHAAKTKLRHRGYNEKHEVEITGSISHTHTVDITALDLPVEVRRVVLDALRSHKTAQGVPNLGTHRLPTPGAN